MKGVLITAPRVVGIVSSLAISFSLVTAPHSHAAIPESKRRIIHTFSKPGFTDVWVSLVEYPSGPKCIVKATRSDGSKSQRSVAVSKAKFEKMWTAFYTSGAEKYVTAGYAIGYASNNYFLMVGNQSYDVPGEKASPVLISLVKELRDYAK